MPPLLCEWLAIIIRIVCSSNGCATTWSQSFSISPGEVGITVSFYYLLLKPQISQGLYLSQRYIKDQIYNVTL